jgi:two-component system, LytTR family, response regulator LytT
VTSLSVLAVEDELPSLDELTFLLERSPQVGRVTAARNADEALHQLQLQTYDVVLLDIRMPGLDGLELARVLSRFAEPPALAFVTAHEEHALEAFDVGAIGYLLKPIDERRLRQLLARVSPPGASEGEASGAGDGDTEMLAVVARGSTRMLARSEVIWVEAAGDYVRLHTAASQGHGHLLRVSMTQLEEEWSAHGFVRVHRSYLVALRAVREIITEGTHTTVRLPDRTLPVSRRNSRELRDRLVRGFRPGGR